MRRLPAVGKLLTRPEVRAWLDAHPESVVTAALRDAVGVERERIAAGRANGAAGLDDAVLQTAAELITADSRPSLRRVINATGIVLHTGLGRAPLGPAALAAIAESAGRYGNLELDLDSGQRGRRSTHVARLLCRLTGAEAATVVNNNAAATLLILNTLGGSPDLGRRRRQARPEVIVSRGQLIEIGGSYRLPDIMKTSGVKLVEVGTTNRTRIGDYAAAISERTAALLRVHTSNYRVTGFTEEVGTGELVGLGREHGLPVVDDLGSGALVDLQHAGLQHEPVVADSLRAGADVVCFSGDKLVGGTQAGVIVGSARVVSAIEKNPLMRTYRVDKLTLLALEATLRVYLDERTAWAEIPTLAMLAADRGTLERRARALADTVARAAGGNDPDLELTVVQDVSYAGGGALPAEALPTWAVRVRSASTTAEAVAQRLRGADPPVIARVHKDAVLLDVRTLRDDEFESIAAALHPSK